MKKNTKEYAAMVYGMFVFMYAVELIIKYVTNSKPENFFGKDDKKYWNTYSNGCDKSLYGMSMLTDRVASLYADFGGAIKVDDIRRDANMMIRHYIDTRNYIKTQEDSVKFDSTIFNISQGRADIISSETRNDFILR